MRGWNDTSRVRTQIFSKLSYSDDFIIKDSEDIKGDSNNQESLKNLKNKVERNKENQMIVIEPPKDDLEKLKNELTIKDVPSNGSCLFDAVLESLSINGLAMGYKLRQVVCDALRNGIVDNATFSSQLQSMNLDKKQYMITVQRSI